MAKDSIVCIPVWTDHAVVKGVARMLPEGVAFVEYYDADGKLTHIEWNRKFLNGCVVVTGIEDGDGNRKRA